VVEIKPAEADRSSRDPTRDTRRPRSWRGRPGRRAHRGLRQGGDRRRRRSFRSCPPGSDELASDPAGCRTKRTPSALRRPARNLTAHFRQPLDHPGHRGGSRHPAGGLLDRHICGRPRKTSPLRRLAENHKSAASIACFADSSRDLERLIDEEIGIAGLAIDGEARGALVQLIGGDRLLSRGEIRKLCIYAADKRSIGIEDVRAIVGDASAFDLDDAIDAIALATSPPFTDIYRRLVASGTPGFVIAGAVLRHSHFSTVPARRSIGGVPSMPPWHSVCRRCSIRGGLSSSAKSHFAAGRIERALSNVRPGNRRQPPEKAQLPTK